MTPSAEDFSDKLQALVKEWARRRDLMASGRKGLKAREMLTYIDGLIDAHSDVLKDVAEHLPSLGLSTKP